ncbi:hypothetical protein ZOSMA_41G00850 [Zostera marina]|uniref:Zinc finger, RING/FYVE/PHD-type n=1 Tax=Zostera marina TaxID=29655 RepID=A0A0K9P2G8_ZOSMR|nr:hypothetical protein ZOSMA_41G00850 [Zostera marina]
MTNFKGTDCTNADVCVLHKQWDELTCPICMEHPHNAVLLLCNSHEKGCSSYICDTSYRHSNCLDRFKKLRVNTETSNLPNRRNSSHIENREREIHDPTPTSLHSLNSRSVLGRRRVRRNIMDDNVESIDGITNLLQQIPDESSSQAAERHLEAQGQDRIDLNTTEPTEALNCPLCRGSVFGWKIDKDAREYLDLKTRSCSRESCSFSGNYRELRRHARRVHPTTRPADVEPSRQRTWRRLERQQDYGDILSAIRSAMPGAVVFGDYVIDNVDGRSNGSGREGTGGPPDDDSGAGPWWTTFFLFHMFGSPLTSINESRNSSRAWRSHRRPSGHRNLWGENLLGLHDNHIHTNDDDGHDGDNENPIPRRRRRITRPPRSDEQEES